MGTSGPGATNLVTAIATAHMDSAPLVAITGQVGRAMIGKISSRKPTSPVSHCRLPSTTGWSWIPKTLAETIKKAFFLAQTGRPGPVLVDIPKDVFQSKIYSPRLPDRVKLRGYSLTIFGHTRQIKQAANMINQAQRPVILARPRGHGGSGVSGIDGTGRERRHSSDQYLAGS